MRHSKLVGTVSNCAVSTDHGTYAVRLRNPGHDLSDRTYRGRKYLFIVDLRINETLQTGEVRKTKLPFYRLVGAVSNCAYAVRLQTAPTGGESIYLFLESAINRQLALFIE